MRIAHTHVLRAFLRSIWRGTANLPCTSSVLCYLFCVSQGKKNLFGAMKSKLKAAAGVGDSAYVKMLADMGAALILSKHVIQAFRGDEHLKTLNDAQLAMLAYAGKPRRLGR